MWLMGGKSKENNYWLFTKGINRQNKSYEPYAI